MKAPSGRDAPPSAPAPSASSVVSAGMPTTTQCQKPDGVGASGSKQVTTNDFVPSGAPLQDSCGEVLPPLKPQSSNTCASGSVPPSSKELLLTVSAGTCGSRS